MARKSPIAYFVRHGETSANKAGTFRGQADLSLNAEGKLDSKNLGEYFKDIPLNAVYSSPKIRARDTAEEIAKQHNLKVQIVPQFSALDVGYLSGEKKSDHTHVMEYFEKYPQERVPMGESIHEFRARTQPEIKRILMEGKVADNPVVAAVHSSIIHELNHILTGDHKQTLVKPGGIVGVWHDEEKGFSLKALLYPTTGTGDSKYHG
jgi:broad specificity phosphatase PhoE